MMTTTGQELEVKFYLNDLAGLRQKLLRLQAGLEQPRVHEVNLRFDTADKALERKRQVLRLRQDAEVRLTYKGPGVEQAGASLRQELEFSVSDFDTARQLFEALGFQVYMMYEKYRTTYRLGALLVTLDEMPYGDFAEIEGPDGESIQQAARQLGLDWDARNLESYTFLFERVRQALGLSFTDLSFANFAGVQVTAEALGVLPADS